MAHLREVRVWGLQHRGEWLSRWMGQGGPRQDSVPRRSLTVPSSCGRLSRLSARSSHPGELDQIPIDLSNRPAACKGHGRVELVF